MMEYAAVVVYDSPCEADGTLASVYDGHGEWMGNFPTGRDAAGWLEENGYEVAYPEQEDDWSDPVNRMMGDDNGNTAAVYGRER